MTLWLWRVKGMDSWELKSQTKKWKAQKQTINSWTRHIMECLAAVISILMLSCPECCIGCIGIADLKAKVDLQKKLGGTSQVKTLMSQCATRLAVSWNESTFTLLTCAYVLIYISLPCPQSSKMAQTITFTACTSSCAGWKSQAECIECLCACPQLKANNVFSLESGDPLYTKCFVASAQRH